MITAYFWKDNQVIPFTDFVYSHNVSTANLCRCFCFDVTAYSAELRFGIFAEYDDWEHRPLSTFPKEFLATLLIMGVPIG